MSYFERIERDLDAAIDVAERARSRGADPETEVEIPVAQDMADRVENILSIPGVAERVRELEGEMSREEAALELARDFAEGRVGEYDTTAGRIEGAVRTAVALLTEGVVAAPIEGIDRVELVENDDGTDCVRVFYAGPIRSAGGTAQALSVLVADYARSLLDVEAYQPRDAEVERYAEEVALYDRETGLQYSPKDKETKFIARHCPVMLDGEATGEQEVSGYRDLERVDTNSPRGGMCLVLAEGIAQKAPKIKRYTDDLDAVSWPWLADLIDGSLGGDTAEEDHEATEGETPDTDDETAREGPLRVDPSGKYLRDLIAGRPVFGHPSAEGGFRLRYGRARNHGFATVGVHPATMHVVKDFLAAGTQLKTEHPGKAGGVVPVDSIEGPTVRLATGEVRRIDDPEEARELRNGVEAILDLGEYLVNYGEFVENNHPLAPASYTVEWWAKDLRAAGADVQALRDSPRVDLADPTPEQALAWATDHDAPLHPEYTYLWHDIGVEEFRSLAEAVADGEVHPGRTDGGTGVAGATRAGDGDALVVEDTPEVRETLEALLVEHTREERVEIPEWRPLARSLGVTEDLTREWERLPRAARTHGGGENAVEAVNAVAPFTVRERAPTRVGCRMGRPEKSEQRELSPAVHTLFPIGEAGGDQRDVAAAAGRRDGGGDPGQVTVDLGERVCPDCDGHTFRARCPDCGAHTEPHYECDDCSVVCEPDEAGRVECPRCGREVNAARPQEVDLRGVYREALGNVGEREAAFDILKGVKGLTSADKVPEPIEKGVLRAKHGVSAFKDGTVRYDMTDLPVTAVRPAEIGVTPEALRSLGYESDIHGEPLRHDDQLVHLKVQDVVLSEGAADHLLSTADFVDDLLAEYYGLEPFYEADQRADLVGELVFGLAPHTSAAVVGRVVGFTSAAAGYAHPYFHASKRRNCFHPDTKVWYEAAGEWRHAPIEELVETHLDEATAETDDFGALVDDVEGVFVPSLAGGEFVRQPVEAVSKHPAPDHLVRVETAGGRELTVTPDHEVHVFDGDGVVGKRALALSTDDQVVTPAGLDAVEGALDPPAFDLLAEFLAVGEIDDDRLMVRGIEKGDLYDRFEVAFADDWDGEFHPLQSTADHLGLTKKRLSNYCYRESIPVSLLRQCFDSEAALLDWIPEDVSLGMRRDSTSIDRTIEVNERVATLLGYYAAEGFTRAQDTPKGTVHQTTVCGTEADTREFFLATLVEEFGVDPYEENDAKVTASGRLLRAFVATVLDAGTGTDEKRVPQCVFDAPEEVVAAYLRGYFSGDGTVEPGRPSVSATTVSRELKEDLLALLTRLGITARVEHRDPVPLSEQFPEYYDIDDPSAGRYVLTIASQDAMRFADRVGFHLDRKADVLHENVTDIVPGGRRALDGGAGEYLVEGVEGVEYVAADTEFTYCLTVPDSNSLVSNDLSSKQCDGDEDCVMLLMDGLLNFSESYLPDKRGGRMDAPLVMTSRIDPTEIDDEAHNVDIVSEYPREFYEATRRMADPGEVPIRTAEDTLGTEEEYAGFGFTHDTAHIAGGPDLSAYKTLESMTEKMDAQLELARTLRAVDETDVAERVIEYHFLPDLIGNLRAFARQKTRCLDCGTKFRRPPLSGECRECGGDVTLTVHEGSVNKYMGTALEVAETYGCREYTKQRLDILERSIESVFENDRNKSSTLADFM